MTENEIIDFLEDEINGLKEQKYGDVGEIAAEVFKEINGDGRIKVFSAAITALEEIQQYREIGTVEECREAVWKQKPKKRIYPKTALERYYHAPECPNCKRELKPRICGYTLSQAIGIYSYCPWCGQNLEGGEESEEE